MCATCGCGDADVAFHSHEGDHHHDHHHDHDHDHDHGGHEHQHDPFQLLRVPQPWDVGEPVDDGGDTRLQHLELAVLAKNDALAARNRLWLGDRQILTFNLLGGPGAGKTSLLEAVIAELRPAPIFVLEGDQETTHDADRVRAAGARALQITTGRGCHLDAAMIRRGLDELGPVTGSVLFIENVGNLVCPSLFDLGERAKILVLSVTDGEDKPLKYPHAFRSARVLIVSKIDLLPQLDFDLAACLAHVRQINPALRIFCLSVRSGEGVGAFAEWLRQELAAATRPRTPVASVHGVP